MNAILHNIEESSEDDGQARMDQDKSTAMSIFDKYISVKHSIVKAYRIGKRRDPGPNVRPRLLKLIFSSEHDKALVLRNYTKLQNKENPEECMLLPTSLLVNNNRIRLSEPNWLK